MVKRALSVLVAALVVVGVASCSNGDDDAEPGSTSIATETTAPGDPSASSSSSQSSIPEVTQPPGQPAACAAMSESALVAVGVPAGTVGLITNDPDGSPAPSNGCYWQSDQRIRLAVFFGADPLEILATARSDEPGGSDIAGLGADAYFVEGPPAILYVDTGSSAFAVEGNLTQEQLQSLAQNVLANL
jgi:hypothetical protein